MIRLGEDMQPNVTTHPSLTDCTSGDVRACGEMPARNTGHWSRALSATCGDGTQVPWVRKLTIVTQDEAITSTPGAPEPVIDGGSF
jgi:hypothetical protein